MARAGEVEQRKPEGAPQGEGQQLQDLQSAVPQQAEEKSGVQHVQPQQQPNLNDVLSQVMASLPPEAQLQGDQNGGFDQAMFAPTDRPNEPVTHGAPFGPGATFVPQPAEDDHAFMVRVAGLLQSSPAATSAVRNFASRITRGE